MKIFIFLFVFLLSVISQTSISNGETLSGTIAPFEVLNFTFQVTENDLIHIFEIIGTGSLGQTARLRLPDIVLRPATLEDFVDPISDSFEVPHSYGIGCPLQLPIGQYEFTIMALSQTTTQNWEVRYTTETASLNEGNFVSEDVCCRGNSLSVYKQYVFDVPDDSTEVNFFVSRSSDTITSDVDRNSLVIRYDNCANAPESSFDYIFELPDEGTITLTIDQNSNPPLLPGSRMVIAHIRSFFSDNANDNLILSVCSGQGCNPEPTSSFGLSSANSLSKSWSLRFGY